MAPIDAELNVVIDTSQATAELKKLQSSINTINRNMAVAGSTAAAQQAKINSQLLESAKASGMWTARIVPMTTAMNQFSDSLDKGKMSLGQYTRYATSAMPGMSRVFRKEFEMMTRVAEDRVKRMQTQFVNLGTSVNGVGQALALTPRALDQYASSAAVATQRQMMMNRMIDLGSTKLLNWGKNTQWAGRQLMVGFSIPLAMMGAAAAKAFKEIDQSSIAFRRVYGDLQTTTAEMENNLEAVKALGMEYTKYGQSLASTIDLAAKVAATGAENETLMAATEQTIRLATLGMMEYNEAMDATIALQTAFQVSNEDLAQTIDFLNVVENQTVLSMQDMAAAIPRVAPVVKGLGGDVKDLAVFMTAMREGGISAEQGANALKSGLGRLINPTKAAKEMMADFGISIDAILQRNKGDLMGMVKEFGDALATLGQFEQQQVLQKVFGTYQYARLGALFKNIANDAGQAQRTMELTAMSVEDLAKISERELGRIEEATSVKFAAALERLKAAIAPLGEMFMKILMPIIDRVAKVADAFNNLPDGIKNAIGIAVTAIAGIAPVLIMITGLFGNAIANSIKFVQFMRKGFARIKGNASAFDNLTMQELEAKTAADALSGSTDILTGKFLGQQRALIGLTGLLERYKAGLMSIPGVIPGAGGKGGGGKPGTAPLPFAKGGLVPGRGNRDSIPALLTPGESVVTKEATKQYAPILEAMNRGTLAGFNEGVTDAHHPFSFRKAHGTSRIKSSGSELEEIRKIFGNEVAEAYGYSNWTYTAPNMGNQQRMSGNQWAALFHDPKGKDILISQIRAEIAGRFGIRVADISKYPIISQYLDNLTSEMISELKKIGDNPVSDDLFFDADKRAHKTALSKVRGKGSRQLRRALKGAREDITALQLYDKEGKKIGTRTELGVERQRQIFKPDESLPGSRRQQSYISRPGSLASGKLVSIEYGTRFPVASIIARAMGLRDLGKKRVLQLMGQSRSIVGNMWNPKRPVLPLRRASGGIIPGSGNKDTVPALLTPGESVITKEATSKFGPILEAMNRGTVRGFAEGEIQIDEEDIRYRDDPSKPVRSHGTAPIPITPEQLAEYQTQTKNQALREATSATGLSSWIYGEPQLANDKLLTGIERGSLFAGGAEGSIEAAMRAQVMQPLEEAVRRFDPDQLVNDPDIKRLSSRIADNMATGLTEVGVGIVDDQIFQQIDERAFREALEAPIYGKTGTEKLSSAQQEAIQRVRTTTTALVVSGPRGKSRVSVPGGLSYKNISVPETGVGITPFLTTEGDEQRRRIAEQKAARRLAYQQSQRTSATAMGAAIPVPNRSDIRQLLEESGLGPAARETQRAERERVATEKARQREIRRQEIISGRRLTQPLGPRVTPQAGPQSSRVVDLGMPGMREGMAAQQEQTQQIKKQSQMLSKLSNAGMMAGFGLMGLTTAASFAGGSIAEMAQKIMPVAGVLSALPMLMNPVGLAIAAVGGLTAAMIMGQNHMEDLAKSAADAGANIGGVADSLKILEEATGFTAPTVQDRLFRFTEQDRTAMAEFSSFFEGERGSKFVQDLQKVTSQERYEKVAYILAQGIASGLDPEKAKAFGFAIAEATNDGFLKSNIARDFANNAFGYGADKLIELERNRMKNAPRMERIGNFIPGQTNIYGGTDGAGRGVRVPQFLEGASQLVNNLFQKGSFGAQFFGLQGGKTDQTKALEQGYKVLGFASQQITNLANAEAVLQQQRAEGTISLREYQDQEKQIQDIRKQTTDEMGKIFKLLGTAAPDIKAGFESQLQLAGFDEGQITALLDQIAPEDLAQQIFEKSYLDLSTAQQKYIDEVFARTISGMTPENMNQRLLDIENIWKTVGDRYIGAIESGTLDATKAATRVGLTQTVAGMLGPGGGGMAAGGQVVGRAEARITQYQAELTNLKKQRDLQQNLVSEMSRASRGVTSETYNKQKAKLDDLNNKIKETQGSILDLQQYISDTDITVAEKIGKNIINTVEKLNQRFSITEQEILNVAAGFKDRKFMQDLLSTEQGVEKLAKAMNLLKDYEDINIEFVLKTNQDPSTIVRAINEIKNMKLDSKIFGNAAIDADKIVQAFIEMGVKAGLVPGKLEKSVAAVEKFGKAALTSLGTIKPKIMPQIIADVFGTSATTSGQISDALNAAFPSQLSPIDLAIVLSLAGDKNALALLTNPQAIAAARRGEQTLVTTERRGQDSFTRQFNLSPLGALGLTGETPGAGKGPGAEKDGGGGGGKSWWQQQLADLKANTKLFGDGANSIIARLRALNIPEQIIQAMGTGEEGLKNAQEMERAVKQMGGKRFGRRMQRIISEETLSQLEGKATATQVRQVEIGLEKRGVEKNIIDEIIGNEEYLAIMRGKNVGQQERLIATLRGQLSTQDLIDAKVQEVREEHEKTERVLNKQIKKQEDIVQAIQDQIDELEKKNEQDQWAIRGKEREKELIDRQIESIERANEIDQRRIETLQRQDEIRNREADALSHELDQLSLIEDQIRKSYQERIDALDKVAQVNDYIIDQQKKQLGLSQAISQGDIYAATSAAQEMRASSAQFSIDQTRAGLEQGMENAINNLTTSSGLTRQQAEEKIRQIKEQSYQTSLLIRDIEDVIYKRNQEIIPLKDQQRAIDDAIRVIADRVYARENDIYNIRTQQLQPAQKVLDNIIKEKDELQAVTDETIYQLENTAELANGIKDVTGQVDDLAAAWYQVAQTIKNANDLAEKQTKELKIPKRKQGETASSFADRQKRYEQEKLRIENERVAKTQAALEAGKQRMKEFAAKGVAMFAGGKVKGYAKGKKVAGSIPGNGSRDSVNAMLTPGEFVVRKAMVNKYGTPMLDAINQGSFAIPKFAADQSFVMPQYTMPTNQLGGIPVQNNSTSVTSVNAPVYNTYDMKFSISGTNVSADEVANKVMFKMKQIQNQAIRGNRGY